MAESQQKKQEAGLRSFRNPGGAEMRKPDWGNPNKKRAARIRARIKSFESMGSVGPGYHRPGSGRKPL